MLPLQRKQALLAYLADKGAATLKEMSDRFGVSEMTIRRDLNALEQENRIRRSHGGAVYEEQKQEISQDEPEIEAKQAVNQDIKERLAAYAAQRFVRSGDTIVLENGTTVSRMAERLAHLDQLTILTNGIDTISRFRPYATDNRMIISCGGMFRDISGTFVGPMAEEFFSRFHADTLFLSALGYTPEAGFTDPNLMDTQVKKIMMRSAKKVVMLLDSSKIGKRFFSPVAALTDIHVFVTDDNLTHDHRKLIEESGVELHII
ncbi:DeoR/GlpR family DNA-binding transcription regulator [Paenibacillus sp. BK720]|uniref:DeoR/GlpR family DNA-binding transcription regulator n=1 Tax=Paenibacillus sp. BK720 TaxID=2587092 RepID=UPI0014200E1A|nr:DeoR/GlpR family DNA-binding transcription regulator [Paenibacillus sp. BK720]NIK68605.1 DeoR family glucitol operon repressor [Paenibacillus sp. BK720]